MKRVKRLVIPNGEYTDKNGDTKTSWLECGSLLEGGGKMKVKLDAVPTSKEFDGWFQCFDIEPRQGKAQGGSSKMGDWN
jgi:hypothetical protein